MANPRAVTILDVAAKVGVHASTVSRAISQPEKVAPATRERVQQVVREMGFVPNRAARGLITGRTGNLAVIVPDITNPYFAAMLRAAEGAARQRDQQLLLVDTGEHAEAEVAAARSLSRQVDGFIVASPRRLHRELDALGSTPVVFVNRPVRGCPSIVLRAAAAIEEAVRHLVERGHQQIAHAGGPSGSWAATERQRALRRASARLGIELVELGPAEPTFDAGHAVADHALEASATAVLAFNDQMALGVIARLDRLGVRVPDDMSVIGCDDVPMAAMVSPALTTIHMPTEEAGRAAVACLLDGTATAELSAHLVVRSSTALSARSLGRPAAR